MKKIFGLLALITILSGCSKDLENLAEFSAINPVDPAGISENHSDPLNPLGNPVNAPYQIPDVKSASDFAYIIYIDPGYSGPSDGTIERPFADFNKQYQNGIPSNTAFLFKSGTNHPKIGRGSGPNNVTIYSKMVWKNNFVGPYGQGRMPVIGGFFISPGSDGLTIRNLHLAAESQRAQGWDAVVYIHKTREDPVISKDITVAHCIIEGKYNSTYYYNPLPYPKYIIRFFCDNFTLYNNIIRDSWEAMVVQTTGTNFKCVRNWMYNIGHQDKRALSEGWPSLTSKDPWASNHLGQRSVAGWANAFITQRTHNSYYAGNIFDKSFSRWKATFYFYNGWNSANQNLIMEYNTFIPPKAGRGGVALNFDAPKGSIFRYNLVDCSNKGNDNLVPGLAGNWPHGNGSVRDHLRQTEPSGFHYNHWIKPKSGSPITGQFNGDHLFSPSNKIFNNWNDYQKFLGANSQVGSDINTSDFLGL